ncbi:hypothetical protein Pelo_2941 [Pelomyxa schiedti]|nr:hypothetical protein Pelo_2941 [Pelomyxa schiedti]
MPSRLRIFHLRFSPFDRGCGPDAPGSSRGGDPGVREGSRVCGGVAGTCTRGRGRGSGGGDCSPCFISPWSGFPAAFLNHIPWAPEVDYLRDETKSDVWAFRMKEFVHSPAFIFPPIPIPRLSGTQVGHALSTGEFTCRVDTVSTNTTTTVPGWARQLTMWIPSHHPGPPCLLHNIWEHLHQSS